MKVHNELLAIDIEKNSYLLNSHQKYSQSE